MIDIEELSIPKLADRIENLETFSLMRWGDGEMSHVLGRPIGSTDANGHQYFPELRDDLHGVIKERVLMPEKYGYMLAMQSLGYDMFKDEWDKYIDLFGGIRLKWVWSDPFMWAAKQIDPPGLLPIVAALNTRNVIMVGPGFLRGNLPFEYERFIEVPRVNCYLSLQTIIDNIERKAANLHRPIIPLSFGMAAKPLLHKIYPYITAMGGTIIDFGSLWDMFAGVRARSCYANIPNNILEIYRNAK